MNRRIVLFAGTAMLTPTLAAQADLIFSQDFSDSTSAADYIVGSGAAINGDKLTKIGTTGTGASVSIENGALVLQTNGNTGSAGFTIENVAGATSPTLMAIQFTLDVDAQGYTGWNNQASFAITDYDGHTIDDFNLGSPRSAASFGIEPTGGAAGSTSFRLYPSGGGRGGSVTEPMTITLFMNNTATAQDYTFAGNAYTLNAGTDGDNNGNIHGTWSLFVGETLQQENLVFSRDWPQLEDLRFSTGSEASNQAIYRFDDIRVYDSLVIPEPASLALLGLGGVCMLKRRVA